MPPAINMPMNGNAAWSPVLVETRAVEVPEPPTPVWEKRTIAAMATTNAMSIPKIASTGRVAYCDKLVSPRYVYAHDHKDRDHPRYKKSAKLKTLITPCALGIVHIVRVGTCGVCEG